MTESNDGIRWLLLVHRLPPRPSNLRVRIWRRLQQVGAVVLRNSIYVLPNSAETREDFNWIRAEIAGTGGQVSVLEANVIDGYTDDELVEQFRQQRDIEYGALTTEVRVRQQQWAQNKRRPSRGVMQRELRKLRERLTTIAAVDYFSAAGAATAKDAVDSLQRSVNPRGARATNDARLDPKDFNGRTWVTRPRPGIDRMASAWFVRRFVASDARFAFTSRPNAPSEARIPFDMPDVEFGHQGTDCTFETFVRRFAVSDPAVQRVGQLVHDLDLKESRYGLPERVAIGRLVEGFRELVADDHELLERGMLMIEALYRSFVHEATATTRRSKKTRRRPSPQKQRRTR